MIRAAYDFDGPIYIRFGRMATPVFHDENYKFVIGRGELLRDGSDAAIVATGILVTEAIRAAEILSEKNISVRGAAGDLLKQFGLCADNIVKQTESMVRDNVV